MRASELMVGDWIEYSSKYKHGVGKIAGIEPREGSSEPTTFTVIDDNLMLIGVSRVNVKPILITPEILEKNGFEYTKPEFGTFSEDKVFCFENTNKQCRFELEYQEDDNLNTFYVLNSTSGYQNVTLLINYVHELQHVLKLCKIEKEIEL